MDPLAAIGLMSSLITFVEFSWKLVSGAKEIYDSVDGVTSENYHIATIIADLRVLTDNIDTRGVCGSYRDKPLKQLAANCRNLSDELLGILDKLRVSEKNSKWQALRAKWDSLRYRDEITSIRGRIADYRSEIMLQLNAMMIGQQSIVKTQLEILQHETEAFYTASARELDGLRHDVRAASGIITRANRVFEDQSRKFSEQSESLRQVRDSLLRLQKLATRLPRENRILGQIYFEKIHAHEEAIRDAEKDTFDWLLEGPEPYDGASDMPLKLDQFKARQMATEKLLRWLSSERGIFHISGKPGSGKSTAMKLIYNHETTMETLAAWAQDKILVSAHFYFWNSGHTIQMSLEGLYRSILFEVLRSCPELIPVLFPAQWASLAEAPLDEDRQPEVVLTSAMFQPSKFSEAFHALVTSKMPENYRFCFFVDGLDEYQGDSVDQWELAENISTWGRGDAVKFCVSSRPYTEFLATFDERRRLYLHDLNKFDIYTFSRHMLENDRNFRRISNSYNELVLGIVERAEGVFLWARLVVRVLLTSIGRFDSEATLYKKMEILPKDLEALYDNLLGGLDSFDRHLCNLILLITLHNSRLSKQDYPLSVLALSYVQELENKSFPLHGYVQVCSNDELAERFEQVKRQISSLTKGLVEIGPANNLVSYEKQPWAWIISQQVRFFHRTVPDYLQENAKLDSKGFDWESIFTRLRFAEIASLDKSNISLHPLDQLRLHQELEHLLKRCVAVRGDEQDMWTSSDLIASLKHALEPAGPALSWYWVYDYRLPGFLPWFYDKASFYHYLAFKGYKTFLLKRIHRRKKVGDNEELDVLLSAACGLRPDKDFIVRLLNAGYSPQRMMRTFKRFTEPDIVPDKRTSIWMLFLGQFVDYTLKMLREDKDSVNLSDLKQRMEIFAEFVDRGVNMQAILCFTTPVSGGANRTSSYITLHEFVRTSCIIFDDLNKQDIKPQSYTSLARDTRPLDWVSNLAPATCSALEGGDSRQRIKALKAAETFELRSAETLSIRNSVCFRLF